MFVKTKKRLASFAFGVLGLLLVAMPAMNAKAATYNFGGWDVQVDATLSAGLSVLMKDTNTHFLAEGNGGTQDLKTWVDLTRGGAAQFGVPGCGTLGDNNMQLGSFCSSDLGNGATGADGTSHRANENFSGSINTDDGRLNFNESGDLIGGTTKALFEFEAYKGPVTVFARVSTFYDAVLMDESNFQRGGLSAEGAEAKAGRNIELLDAYLSYDLDIGSFPLHIRAGRQVINWGEATFIPGGNSSFNPIDVAALRRPGAEIKEALLPVEALYASIALSPDVTIEAYYGGWDEYRLDVGGTYIAGSDSFNGFTKNGNDGRYFYGGGGRSGVQYLCAADGLSAEARLDAAARAVPGVAVQLGRSADLVAAFDAAYGDDNPCNVANGNIDLFKTWTPGKMEQERLAANWPTTRTIHNANDQEGDDQIGIALRWYSEELNSTEFAFYYQKGDSRLPYVSYIAGPTGNQIGAQATTASASQAGRVSHLAGGAIGATCAGLVNNAAVVAGTTAAIGYTSTPITVLDTIGLGDPYNLAAAAGRVLAAANLDTFSSTNDYTNGVSVGELLRLNCDLHTAQAFNSALLPTGAVTLTHSNNIGLFSEFPEVETYGMSFNTTVAGIGLQGDFTYRPDVPLQIDTDVLAIAALFRDCTFDSLTVGPSYIIGSVYQREFGTAHCQPGVAKLKGYVEDYDAYTWDIGTTTVFAQSSPVLEFFGANGGVLVTEFQGLYVPNIDERNNPGVVGATSDKSPLSNTCTSGSDLPLAGILAIDNANAATEITGICRPTESSWGAVGLFRLDYNNVGGTPITLSPTVIISGGVEGYAPSPIGFWREGVGSVAYSLGMSYLSNWQASISYRDFFGSSLRTKNTDRDHMSLSVSYAF